MKSIPIRNRQMKKMIRSNLDHMIVIKEKQKMKHIIKSAVTMIQRNWREYRRTRKSFQAFKECVIKLKASNKIVRWWRKIYKTEFDKRNNSALII